MARLISALVWGIGCAVLFGGGGGGLMMLTGPKTDPSVFGTAMLSGLIFAVVGFVGGALYGGLKSRAKAT